MEPLFITEYAAILSKLNTIDPLKYAQSRNFINGQVNYLSPYISRGVISTRQVLDYLIKKGAGFNQIEPLVQQLCWRDYFQRIAQEKNINGAIKQEQEKVSNHGLSSSIIDAETGIEAIDKAIITLYKTGYMHNHARLYTAALVCNNAQSHWLHPAQWMYYHLLDGDWASNACSWQWVAGANSSKKYFANQSNINTFANTKQSGTFLDTSYEELQLQRTVPNVLFPMQQVNLVTTLPESTSFIIDASLPTYIYNYYNLDPKWHANEVGNRILLLDPQFFKEYPVGEKCINFMLDLSKNIANINVFVGSFDELTNQHTLGDVFFKEHPFNFSYKGFEEPRDWIAPLVTGYFPSFFAYWKRVKKHLTDKIKA